jgi:hypothetical protein
MVHHFFQDALRRSLCCVMEERNGILHLVHGLLLGISQRLLL